MKKHKFKDSLEQGKEGERLFLDKMTDKVVQLDGLKADFKLLADNRLVELKSDFYDMSATDNFFMERWSNSTKKSNGGPWQALDNNTDLFVYWFPLNNYMYVFETTKLVEKLKNVTKNMELVKVLNKGYITLGYKVERSLLKDVILQEKEI